MTSKIDRREFLLAGSALAAWTSMVPRPTEASTGRLQIVGMRVDEIEWPLGLENRQPRFSCHLLSTARNVRQVACRIGVASTEEIVRSGHGDLWDSGKIVSS